MLHSLLRALTLAGVCTWLVPLSRAQTINLAAGGFATQSSTDYGGLPARAIDGDTDGVWSNDSVTHTANQSDSWWQVDLGAVHPLTSVRIYNRQDCCWLRLSNFYVAVRNASTEVFREDFFLGSGSVGQGAMFEVALPAGTVGDVVAIGIYGTNNDGNGFLSLAEVEVFGSIGTRYCQGAPNSVGPGAMILATGSTSVAAADLTLTSAPVPDQPSIFFYAPNQVNLSFGNGFLCAAGGAANLPVVFGSGNAATHVIDFNALPAAGPINAGDTWNFQHWYRDPAAGGAYVNTSDAVSILFTP